MTRKVAISEGDMLLTKLQKGPLALKSNLQFINRSWLFLIKDTGIKHHNKKTHDSAVFSSIKFQNRESYKGQSTLELLTKMTHMLVNITRQSHCRGFNQPNRMRLQVLNWRLEPVLGFLDVSVQLDN
jgi:hypothetical protein